MFGLTPFNRRHTGLTRKNDFMDIRNVLDDFFSDTMLPSFFTGAHPLRADIREGEKEYIIDAEIPGVNKEDIKLDLRDDVLTISVEQKSELNEERENYIRKERRYGSYARSFYVENVKHENVTAKYDNGVLTVTLPKDNEGKEKRHKIDIQ